MSLIKTFRTALAFVRRPVAWREDRIARAVSCPGCGHGGQFDDMDEVIECRCEESYCACNPSNQDWDEG